MDWFKEDREIVVFPGKNQAALRSLAFTVENVMSHLCKIDYDGLNSLGAVECKNGKELSIKRREIVESFLDSVNGKSVECKVINSLYEIFMSHVGWLSVGYNNICMIEDRNKSIKYLNKDRLLFRDLVKSSDVGIFLEDENILLEKGKKRYKIYHRSKDDFISLGNKLRSAVTSSGYKEYIITNRAL